MVGKGLRRTVELDDDKVFDNFMKDPELAIEYEILVAGSGGHEDGLDGVYGRHKQLLSIKYGKSGD